MNECINKYRKFMFTLKYSHKYSYYLYFQKLEAIKMLQNWRIDQQTVGSTSIHWNVTQ